MGLDPGSHPDQRSQLSRPSQLCDLGHASDPLCSHFLYLFGAAKKTCLLCKVLGTSNDFVPAPSKGAQSHLAHSLWFRTDLHFEMFNLCEMTSLFWVFQRS